MDAGTYFLEGPYKLALTIKKEKTNGPSDLETAQNFGTGLCRID